MLCLFAQKERICLEAYYFELQQVQCTNHLTSPYLPLCTSKLFSELGVKLRKEHNPAVLQDLRSTYKVQLFYSSQQSEV